ncbi:MAG TPA: hypothetical protein PKC17_10805, partial [Geobacter anodireducens]|nr:hypothetical protein [Geobacter anodireducens]
KAVVGLCIDSLFVEYELEGKQDESATIASKIKRTVANHIPIPQFTSHLKYSGLRFRVVSSGSSFL